MKKAEEEYAAMEKMFTDEIGGSNKGGAYESRATLYAYLGKNEKAIADYSEEIKLEAQSENALSERGALYVKMGEKEKAMQDFNDAIRIAPDESDAYFNRAGLFTSSGDYAKALDDLKKALDLSPDWTDAVDAEARIRAGCPKAEFRDPAKAMELALKAGEYMKWKDASALDTLAYVEAEAGKFDDAVKHQQQALEIAKADIESDKKTLDTMAAALESYRKKKPYEDAHK